MCPFCRRNGFTAFTDGLEGHAVETFLLTARKAGRRPESGYAAPMTAPAFDDPDSDLITIQGLDVPVHIGVPDAEREHLQNVLVDVEMRLCGKVEDAGDDIQSTVDYEEVAGRVRAVGAERPRRLIETLAADVAQSVLQNRLLASVKVTVRKRILPGTAFVAVSIVRYWSE